MDLRSTLHFRVKASKADYLALKNLTKYSKYWIEALALWQCLIL